MLESDERRKVFDFVDMHEVVDELGHLVRVSIVEGKVAEAIVDVALDVGVERSRTDFIAGHTRRI